MNSQSALHYNTYKSLVCCVWGQSGQCPSDYWCLPWYSDCFFYHIYAFCCILSSFSVLAFRLTVSHWLIDWLLLITWPCWWSRWWLWKQLRTVSASVRMFRQSFSWDCSVFGLYLTLHFLSLSVFPDVSVHTCVSFITRVFKSVFFDFILHSCVFPSPPRHPALFSEASCSSPVLYLSFLVLSLTLDFGFWTLDIILSKLTFCYSTCLPASVSALVTGFIASNKRISLLWIPLLTWTAEKTSLCLNLAKRQRRCPHSRNDDIVCFRKFPQNSKCFMPLQQPQRSITVLGGTDEICSPAQASDQQIGF